MAKKIFLICLTILLCVQAATEARSLAEEERIKVAVAVSDASRHNKALNTAQRLEIFLSNELVKKGLLTVVGTKDTGEPVEDATTAKTSDVANFGELLVFDAVELPAASETPEDFDQAFYESCGASYVVRCEVLALGLTKVEDKTISMISGATGTVVSLIGSGDGSRSKTLRRVGAGIGFGGFIVTDRTALNTVVNIQFIDVTTSKVLWQENFIGQAVKHHSPGKNYPDAWTRAYNESVEDAARRIGKRVNKYVDKVIIKGKSDKSFLPKGFSIGGGLIGSKTF